MDIQIILYTVVIIILICLIFSDLTAMQEIDMDSKTVFNILLSVILVIILSVFI